jgi:hypothetical protein
MRRRTFLVAAAGGAGAALAGCERREVSTGNPDVIDDRPSKVYVPSHIDDMRHVGTASVGRLRFAFSLSRPHRFWLVTGTRVRRVSVQDGDAMHLMVTVWDAETGTILPASNATVTVARDGEAVVEKSLWSMLSQTMGVHFGDNVALEGDGTYEVSVDYGPIESYRSGGLVDLDPGPHEAAIDLEYSESAVGDLGFEDLGYRAGGEDAVEPMAMDMIQVGQLPAPEDLPGTALGVAQSGGAKLAGTVLDSPPAGIDGEGPYLAVSARTPYNRFPLPFASLSANGGTGEAEPLLPAIDPRLGFHYGRILSGQPAPPVEVTVDAPPQLARHEGYETAFVDMPGVTLGGESG